ncbi:autotransporter outer membrane beta-barrel domain-containing protein [Mesorhizobium sp.]|uniref:autotransporter outer membrane beta-barrel domain-containing protein n=1 Tax=Mesorhizobium sp. TaxID=1871066 RepID=UPI0025D49161|nr:autotransporter outer membrane beta-barrel domain-containing protein [Mesorhizobium sp.]
MNHLLGNGPSQNCKFAEQFHDPDLTYYEGNFSGSLSVIDTTRGTGLIGPNLSRHCFPNTENLQLFGGSALGGGMSSLQSTRTVSQFDLSGRALEQCDPSKDPDCKDDESETVSNYFYQEPLPQSANAFFHLNGHDGVLNANTLIPFDGFSVFGKVEYENYRQSRTRYQRASDIDTFTTQFGALWNLSDESLIGITGTYSTGSGVSPGPKNVSIETTVPGAIFNANFEDLCGVPSDGAVDTDEFRGSILYQRRWMGSAFISAEVGVSKSRTHYSNSLCNVDVTLLGNSIPFAKMKMAGIISGTPTVYGVSADLRAGYDWEYSGALFGPRLSFDALWNGIDSYSETEERGTKWVPTGAGLRYDDQNISSIQTRIGFAISTPLVLAQKTVVPFAQLDYVHEFANDQRTVSATFVEDNRPDPFGFSFKTNPPDRNFLELRGGVVAEIFEGGVAFVDGRATLANELIDDVGVTAGVRVAF